MFIKIEISNCFPSKNISVEFGVLCEDGVHRIEGGAGKSESKLPLYSLAALRLNLPEGQRNAEFPLAFFKLS